MNYKTFGDMKNMSMKEFAALVLIILFVIAGFVVPPMMNPHVPINQDGVDIKDSLNIVVKYKYRKDRLHLVNDGYDFYGPTWVDANDEYLYDLIEKGDSLIKQKDSLYLTLIRDDYKTIFTIEPGLSRILCFGFEKTNQNL